MRRNPSIGEALEIANGYIEKNEIDEGSLRMLALIVVELGGLNYTLEALVDELLKTPNKKE